MSAINRQSISPLVIILLLTSLSLVPAVRAQFGPLFGNPSPWASAPSSSSVNNFGFPPRRPFFDNFRPLNNFASSNTFGSSYPTFLSSSQYQPRPQSPARECRKTGACKNMDHGTTLATTWLMPTTTTPFPPTPPVRPTTTTATTTLVPASVTSTRSPMRFTTTTTRLTTAKPLRISRGDETADYTLSSPANSSTSMTTVTSMSSTRTTTTTTTPKPSVAPSTLATIISTTTTTRVPFTPAPVSSNRTNQPNLTTTTATSTIITTRLR